MRRFMLLLLLCLIVISASFTVKAEANDTDAPIKSAIMEGELVSPTGNYSIDVIPATMGLTACGLFPAKKIQITDTKSGQIVWESHGWYKQVALWSPDGRYVAISHQARTWGDVFIIDTKTPPPFKELSIKNDMSANYSYLTATAWLDNTTLALKYKNIASEKDSSLKFTYNLAESAPQLQRVTE